MFAINFLGCLPLFFLAWLKISFPMPCYMLPRWTNFLRRIFTLGAVKVFLALLVCNSFYVFVLVIFCSVPLNLVCQQSGLVCTGKWALIACVRFYAEMYPLNVSQDGLFLLCSKTADVRTLGIALEECYHVILKPEDFCPVLLCIWICLSWSSVIITWLMHHFSLLAWYLCSIFFFHILPFNVSISGERGKGRADAVGQLVHEPASAKAGHIKLNTFAQKLCAR